MVGCLFIFRSNCFQSPISFCEYPFLFDAQAKTLLLRCDATRQVSITRGGAERGGGGVVGKCKRNGAENIKGKRRKCR